MSTHTYRTVQARYLTRGRFQPIRHVTVHSTEGSTAAGAASWFTNPAAGGSAHVVVDDTEVYRCVDDADSAWHVKGANSYSLGLEIVGFARWSTAEWMSRRPRLTEAARIHAGWCLKHAIPLVWSSGRGYHSHAKMPGNDHWDPGPGFPWSFYLSEVRRFMGIGIKPDPAPLPHGGSLRLTLRVVGAEAPYLATAGWEESLSAMRTLARKGFKAENRQIAFSWRGGTWRAGGAFGGSPNDVVPVIRTVLTRFAGGY